MCVLNIDSNLNHYYIASSRGFPSARLILARPGGSSNHTSAYHGQHDLEGARSYVHVQHTILKCGKWFFVFVKTSYVGSKQNKMLNNPFSVVKIEPKRDIICWLPLKKSAIPPYISLPTRKIISNLEQASSVWNLHRLFVSPWKEKETHCMSHYLANKHHATWIRCCLLPCPLAFVCHRVPHNTNQTISTCKFLIWRRGRQHPKHVRASKPEAMPESYVMASQA